MVSMPCVELASMIQEKLASVEETFLLLIADEDVVVKNAGSEELIEISPSPDKTVKRYPALHGLLCEPSPLFDEIKKDMLDWIAERV